MFLRATEQALASGDPERGLDACEGIRMAVEETLPQETARLAAEEPPADAAREEEARRVLDKRLAETLGLSLQMRLAWEQLAQRKGDALRLVALLTATRRQLRALSGALDLWAVAMGAQEAAEEGDAMDALRAAREALVAGVPEAAPLALAAALRRGLAAPLRLPPRAPVDEALARWREQAARARFDVEEAVALADALDRGTRDGVAAWRWLDEVERVVQLASMSPVASPS